MNLKPPLIISDQISRLESRGLVINDKEVAKSFLEHHNYYQLNAYFHKFYQTPDLFIKGTTFDRIVEIYNTDAWLRHQIFAVIEPIEVHLRCRIAYHLATKYDSDVLYQFNAFDDVRCWEENLSKITREIFRNKNNPVVKHHVDQYRSIFPIWVAAEFISLGTLSMLYSNLKQEDSSSIANDYFGIPDEYLKSWLHSITVLRNICAHSGYLFRREIPTVPKKFPDMSWVQSGNSKKLFVFLYVIKRLSTFEDWQVFFSSIVEYDKEKCCLNSKDYDFPENWTEILK